MSVSAGNSRGKHRAPSRLERVGVIRTMLALVALGVWIAASAPAAIALPAECTQSVTTVTCTYTTPGDHVFVVPSGVSVIHGAAIGGRGGDSSYSFGGRGAHVSGDLFVTPGASLHAMVGGDANRSAGGANGGGSGHRCESNVDYSGGGGGASDIRTGANLNSRLLVAGGGGGAGCGLQFTQSGGNATVSGQPSNPTAGQAGGGQAGCQSAVETNCGLGGVGGTGNVLPTGEAGGDGVLGTGGEGGGGAHLSHPGGGGGGGLFGGGGGGEGAVNDACFESICAHVYEDAGGGGGGSSLALAEGSISIASGAPMVGIQYELNPQPISFTSGAPPAGSVGVPYTFTYTATGDSGLTFTIRNPSQPPGLTMASDGAFSGTPSTAGTYTFTVTVNGDSGGVAHREDTVQIAPPSPPPPPVASVSPSSLDFGHEVVGATSSAQSVTLSNTGDGPLTLTAGGATLGGSDPSEFAVLADGCRGGTLAPGASCAVDVVFQPTTVGGRSATLSFQNNAPDSPQSIALTGTGSPPRTPAVQLGPVSLDLGSQAIGTSSPYQMVTLTNIGDAPLSIAVIGLGGSDPLDFAFNAGGDGGCFSATLAAGASCTVDVAFQPTTVGARAATLLFHDDAPDSPQSIPLTGLGTPPPTPVARITPAGLDFGNLVVGSTSSAQTVHLSNTGDGPLTVADVELGGTDPFDFAFNANVDDGCFGATLAPGASCEVDVFFQPTTLGSRSATLNFSGNASGSPHSVSLTGTGVSPAADLAVSISATPNPVKSGGKITYTITAFNDGPSTATNVLLNDTLSSQSTFVSARPSQGSCVTPTRGATGTISCNLGSLAKGSSNVTEIIVTVTAKKTTITNTARVSSSTTDPNSANNTAAITTRVK